MDWTNERYVRIYVRDTLTWARLGFEGQTVFLHIARKLTRAGVLELAEDLSAAEAVTLMTTVPEAIAEAGLERLLRLGVFELHERALVAPNWRAAQEAKQSGAQRSRETRGVRKDLADAVALTACVATDTKRVATDTKRVATDTRGHTEEHGDTPSLAKPSLACTPQPPNPTDGPSQAEQCAGVYREVTGNSDLPDLSPTWTAKQREAVLAMARWCGGDLAKLRAELEALRTDRWLAKQPVHLWAERLGTAPRRPGMARPATPEEFEAVEDDFDKLGDAR